VGATLLPIWDTLDARPRVDSAGYDRAADIRRHRPCRRSIAHRRVLEADIASTGHHSKSPFPAWSSRFRSRRRWRGILKHAEYLCQRADFAEQENAFALRSPRSARRDRARQSEAEQYVRER